MPGITETRDSDHYHYHCRGVSRQQARLNLSFSLTQLGLACR